jgi:methyl coenzyme M reductase subunit D
LTRGPFCEKGKPFGSTKGEPMQKQMITNFARAKKLITDYLSLGRDIKKLDPVFRPLIEKHNDRIEAKFARWKKTFNGGATARRRATKGRTLTDLSRAA